MAKFINTDEQLFLGRWEVWSVTSANYKIDMCGAPNAGYAYAHAKHKITKFDI